MDTSAYREKDLGSLWHPYTGKSRIEGEAFPVIVRGDGAYLFDADGNRCLDAISSWWACNLGHGHPRIVEAIAKQAGEMEHSILANMSHPRAIELASRLAGLFEGGGRRVFFGSDGASAVEAALKIALQYRHNIGEEKRNRFASLKEGYHGDTLGAVSVGFVERFHRPFESVLFPVWRAESPCCATCEHRESCNLQCFESMARIFAEHGEELTAVIVEPLCQCAAGMRMYREAYLLKLAGLCRERGVLLIVDEIATGMGRTGMMFAFERAGVDPDIVCMGKGLSGGSLPISATIVRKEIFDTFTDDADDNTFYHGHTFAGNPIACAAALATLDVYESEGIVARAARMGDVLAREAARFGGLPGVSGVRCLGMILAMEVEEPNRVRDAMRAQHGILVRPLGNTVYLMPPLAIDEKLLRAAVEAMHEVIEKT